MWSHDMQSKDLSPTSLGHNFDNTGIIYADILAGIKKWKSQDMTLSCLSIKPPL